MKRNEDIREYRSDAGRARIERRDGCVFVKLDERGFKGGLHLWYADTFESAIKELYREFGCAWQRCRVTHVGW